MKTHHHRDHRHQVLRRMLAGEHVCRRENEDEFRREDSEKQTCRPFLHRRRRIVGNSDLTTLPTQIERTPELHACDQPDHHVTDIAQCGWPERQRRVCPQCTEESAGHHACAASTKSRTGQEDGCVCDHSEFPDEEGRCMIPCSQLARSCPPSRRASDSCQDGARRSNDCSRTCCRPDAVGDFRKRLKLVGETELLAVLK